ncbi:unnamed protein product [Euphydryas editha]|uniref:Uncharacterized protein n=1 Tax=Euphydryas editha TaxID=104508 RepID=A0AAU9TSC8_EUPED|nr:unnamed protein product [Euphydryas editha]
MRTIVALLVLCAGAGCLPVHKDYEIFNKSHNTDIIYDLSELFSEDMSQETSSTRPPPELPRRQLLVKLPPKKDTYSDVEYQFDLFRSDS